MSENELKEIVLNGVKYVKEQSTEECPYVVIRTYSAGVFCGNLKKKDGFEVTLDNCRRMWRWDSKFVLDEISIDGVRNASECKFTCVTQNRILTQVIEIIPCTKQSEISLKNVPNYVA